MLPPLAQALASKAPRKMIVVHLLGTHRKYNYRYPDQFEQFSNADDAPAWVVAETLEKYNSYDNAIRYNDFVLSEIISLLKQETSSTAMAYLSDHGEVVYDTAGQPFSVRNEDAPSPAMYTVPFVLLKNECYDETNPERNWAHYVDRAIQSNDFIYLWLDLVGLNYEGIDRHHSAIAESYVASPRLIGNPRGSMPLADYDELFPRKATVAVTHQQAIAGQHRAVVGPKNLRFGRPAESDLRWPRRRRRRPLWPFRLSSGLPPCYSAALNSLRNSLCLPVSKNSM